jgi:hypothetical protein
MTAVEQEAVSLIALASETQLCLVGRERHLEDHVALEERLVVCRGGKSSIFP